MAVTSRNRRMSLIGFGAPVPMVMANPAGAQGIGERAQLLWLYYGLALNAPSDRSSTAGFPVNVVAAPPTSDVISKPWMQL